jgi:predicted Zn finger-like uncharacterized protein
MFKVECPGCKAPYQVDERRIPASGLKMRCPKCGTSFKVDPPADGRNSGPTAVLGGALGLGAESDSLPPPALAAPAPRPAVDLRGTMLGVAPGGMSAPGPARPQVPAHLKGTMLGVAPAAAGANPPPRPAQNLRGTMLGVAPAPAAPAPAAPAVPAPAASVAQAPVAQAPGKPPPMPPRRAAEVKAPAPLDPDSFFDDSDLPAATAPRPRVPAPRAAAVSDLDLPVPTAPPPARASSTGPARFAELPSAPEPFADLPAMRSSFADLPGAPEPFADLPAMPGPFNEPPSSPAPFADLPATPSGLADLPMAASPPRAHPTPARSFDLDLDLPVASGAPRAPAGRVSSSGADLDLPSARARSASGVGLPSVSPRSPSPASGSTGLPSPGRAAEGGGASSGRSGFGEVGLPSMAAGLPEVSRGAAPSRSAVALPSLTGRGPASSPGLELDDGLPLIGGNSPLHGGASSPERSQAGLPSLSAGLPAFQSSGLPTPSSGGLPAVSAGRTTLPSIPPQYGALDLDIERAPSLPPDFGLDPVKSPSVRASRAEFGELDLPLGGPPSLPPVPRGYAAEAEEADLFGDVAPRAVLGGAPQVRSSAEAIVRQSGGGTAYGEVNLGDEGGEAGVPIEAAPPAARREEDMEFGAIPQEDQPRAKPGVSGPTQVPVAVGRGAPKLPKAKRKLDLRLYGGLFVLFVGGASLSLVPSVGPFGSYLVIDQLKAGEYATLIQNTVTNVRNAMARDTYPEAKQALSAVEAARASAKRVRQLPAYAAFTAFAVELRFGSDPAIHARGAVLLDELAEHPDTPYVALARCARAAAEGQIARAKQLEAGLPPPASGDLDQAFLRAEIALRAADPKAAAAAWQKVVQAQKSPRSSFGLARASYAAGDSAAAGAAARDALAQNPNHVGARILLARISSATRSGEAEALRLLGSIVKSPELAGPDELVNSQTLLGDIHLARSRMSQAEAAYTEALKLNPKAARALNGLGDALYRAGRFSEAQARFEASTQADPDDLSAKVGVAKSKLALERVEDATTNLKKLRDTYPTSVPVAYWFGRALEAAGNRSAAETVYRAVLKSQSLDPQAVDVYIALALLQSQQGQNDEAQKTLADARAKLPDVPAIHKALGEVALSQGRYPQATSEFRQALALDGEDLGARFRLGVALRRDAKFEEAGKIFEQVAAVDKDYPGLALERGLLFETSGRTEEALKEYEGALAKAPKDPDLMLRVGCGKVSAGRAKQAEELLRKVLSERPNSAESNHCLGRALLLEGTRLAEALRLLERAIELDANRAEYHLYAGWAANDAGNVPKAEHALAEALRLDQGLADAYWQRGVLRQRQGAARDAIADLTKALELRPSRHEAHASLADAYYDLGKEPQALREWQQAIAAQPDNATWHFRYGKLLAANHQIDAAREQLNRALELSTNDDPAPRWSWEAHYLLAHATGLKPDAVKHWQEFLRLGPRDSPYRAEAMASLAKLGRPWTGD